MNVAFPRELVALCLDYVPDEDLLRNPQEHPPSKDKEAQCVDVPGEFLLPALLKRAKRRVAAIEAVDTRLKVLTDNRFSLFGLPDRSKLWQLPRTTFTVFKQGLDEVSLDQPEVLQQDLHETSTDRAAEEPEETINKLMALALASQRRIALLNFKVGLALQVLPEAVKKAVLVQTLPDAVKEGAAFQSLSKEEKVQVSSFHNETWELVTYVVCNRFAECFKGIKDDDGRRKTTLFESAPLPKNYKSHFRITVPRDAASQTVFALPPLKGDDDRGWQVRVETDKWVNILGPMLNLMPPDCGRGSPEAIT